MITLPFVTVAERDNRMFVYYQATGQDEADRWNAGRSVQHVCSAMSRPAPYRTDDESHRRRVPYSTAQVPVAR